MKAFNAGKMGSKKQHYFLKCTFGFDTNDAGAFLYGDKQENQNEPLKKRRSQGPSDRMLPVYFAFGCVVSAACERR